MGIGVIHLLTTSPRPSKYSLSSCKKWVTYGIEFFFLFFNGIVSGSIVGATKGDTRRSD